MKGGKHIKKPNSGKHWKHSGHLKIEKEEKIKVPVKTSDDSTYDKTDENEAFPKNTNKKILAAASPKKSDKKAEASQKNDTGIPKTEKPNRVKEEKASDSDKPKNRFKLIPDTAPSQKSAAAEKPLFSAKQKKIKADTTKPDEKAEASDETDNSANRIKSFKFIKKSKKNIPPENDRVKKIDPALVAKATYRIGVSLLVIMIALSLWLGRDSYTFGGLQSWFQIQFTGTGMGDGFPIKIKGHAAANGNFTHIGSNAALLTNTALTVYNQSGKEQYTVRHNFENPDMNSSGGKFILYDTGGNDYIIQDNSKTLRTVISKEDIFSGAISYSGVYGLAVSRAGYASGVDIYTNSGSLKHTYSFADQYITSIAISADGTHGVTCGVTSIAGVIHSTISVFDFNYKDPIYTHEYEDNMLIDVYWGDNDVIYAVGDNGFLWSPGGESFDEYIYGNQWLTSYRLEGNRAMLSISGYEHSGESTLLCFSSSSPPLEIPIADHGKSISTFGNMTAVLLGEKIQFFDSSTGKLMGESDGNYDAKSITLSNERSAFTLSLSEIKYVIADSVKN